MTKIVGSEGPQPKRPGKSKPAPEEAPVARPKADGEKVVLSDEARESNRTGAILKLLAGTIEAKEAAQAAKAEVARRSAIENDRAKAAKTFNDAAREARGALSVAESDGTTLADRKAAAEKVAGLLKKAGEGLPGLDPSAEGAAGDVLDRLQGRLDGLNARIVREDKAVEDAKGRIETDRKALDDALGHSKDEKKLGRTLRDLATRYADPAALGKDLPSDAAKDIQEKAGALGKVVQRAVVQHGDKSSVSEPDNAYLFGRPSKRIKEHLAPVEDWLATPAQAVTSEKRRELLEHLKELEEAVADVEDPVLKAAATAVVGDVSNRAFARLSGAK